MASLVRSWRGRKPDPNAALVDESQRLARQSGTFMRKLHSTEAILDVQKPSEIPRIGLTPNDYVKKP